MLNPEGTIRIDAFVDRMIAVLDPVATGSTNEAQRLHFEKINSFFSRHFRDESTIHRLMRFIAHLTRRSIRAGTGGRIVLGGSGFLRLFVGFRFRTVARSSQRR